MLKEQEEHSSQKDEKHFFSDMEKEILSYWQNNHIFEKTLEKTRRGKPFVFYEGPPYANGKPGIHHVLARSFKDIVLRFKTMQGYHVPRKAGWDTHGLPTEMEVEKKLHVYTKKEIEKLGLETFVEAARANVFEYKHEWEKMTHRMGYWLDLDDPYVTMANEYIESLWWVFSRIAKNGYLYKDYKVLPWCPRCETSLSSHEVAQGYEKVQDESIYVKFQITNSTLQKNSRLQKKAASYQLSAKNYFLVWTTTPWTLPGNVALAINPDATYVTVEKDDERLILAELRLPILTEGWKIIKKQKGKDLVGTPYEPIYPSKSSQLSADSYKIISADFVSTDDGTGIVHIAPAFGADDQKAAKKNNLQMPVTVGEDGKMKTPDYPWDGKPFIAANLMIIQDVQERSLLYKTEVYEHDYPHCWRCKSKLIYYAKDSWFLKTTAVKQKMIRENGKVGWHPEFVGKNRFGEWLRENVDWAISRERYWGMPLPIWKCDHCSTVKVVESLKELDMYAPYDATEVYIMRHGEAGHNIKGTVGPVVHQYDRHNKLTQTGKKEVLTAVKSLRKKGIDVIVTSPLRRAEETAKIISRELGGIKINVRDDLADINVGAWHGKTIQEVDKLLPPEKRFENSFPQGESVRDTRARIMKAIAEIIKENAGKRILIISHGDPLWVLHAALEGAREKEYDSSWYPRTGEVKKITLHNWPYSENRGELDLHRPYVDKVILRCVTCKKGEMHRIKDVADVWFDSGAMPFAQNQGFLAQIQKSKVKIQNIGNIIRYPADYICEGVDQTRGWFYTLLAISSLLKLPAPYKNVITVGLVLDAKGEKMSKSRGNTADPFLLFQTYGADAVRWYFYTINHPWDEKLFDEQDVQDASRRFLMIFWNVFQFWKQVSHITYHLSSIKPKMLINVWAFTRLNEVIGDITKALNEYDVVRAARAIEYFITEDISRWYIRRIRQTMKLGIASEQKETHAVLAHVLLESAKMLAPFIPFLAEKIYQGIGEKESVHLSMWPKTKKLSMKSYQLLENMKRVREIVAGALQLRSDVKIKVRQPLAELRIKNHELGIKHNKELQELIKGEVNVKNIVFGARIKNALELDTTITPELKKEGVFRDLVRHIQQMRKDANLKPHDTIMLYIATEEAGLEILKEFSTKLKKEVGAKEIVTGGITHSLFMQSSLMIENYYFEIGFKK